MEELNQIVQNMIDAGESESNIQLVIENYDSQEELVKTNDSASADPAVGSSQENTGYNWDLSSSESGENNRGRREKEAKDKEWDGTMLSRMFDDNPNNSWTDDVSSKFKDYWKGLEKNNPTMVDQVKSQEGTYGRGEATIDVGALTTAISDWVRKDDADDLAEIENNPVLFKQKYGYSKDATLTEQAAEKIESQDLNLDDTSSNLMYNKTGKTDFVEANYFKNPKDKEMFREANVNAADFQGFLERKGYLREFNTREETGAYTGFDPNRYTKEEESYLKDLNKEQDLQSYFGEYLYETGYRNIERKELQEIQNNPGEYKDMSMSEARNAASKKLSLDAKNNEYGTHLDFNKLESFNKYNWNAITKAEKFKYDALVEYQEERERLNENSVDYATDVAKRTGQTPLEGFSGAVEDLLDDLYFDGVIGGFTYNEDWKSKDFRRTRNKSNIRAASAKTAADYLYVEGEQVKLGDKDYIVSKNGSIKDITTGIDVSTIISSKDKLALKKKIDNGESTYGSDFDLQGGIAIGGKVVGELGIQILGQKGLGTLRKLASLKYLNKAKGISKARLGNMETGFNKAGNMRGINYKGVTGGAKGNWDTFGKKIPLGLNKGMADAIVFQSGYGYMTGNRTARTAALDAGFSMDEANDIGNTAGTGMAILYAATTPINPRIGMVNNMFTGAGKNSGAALIRDLIKKSGSVSAFNKAFNKAVIAPMRSGVAAKALVQTVGGGLQEVVQENIQQVGETAMNDIINRGISEDGAELLKGSYSYEDFINTSILSMGAGSFASGMGEISAVARNTSRESYRDKDRVAQLKLLAGDVKGAEAFFDKMVLEEGLTRNEASQAKELLNNYVNTVGQLPTGELKLLSDPRMATSLLELVNSQSAIKKLENERKTAIPGQQVKIDEKLAVLKEQQVELITKAEETLADKNEQFESNFSANTETIKNFGKKIGFKKAPKIYLTTAGYLKAIYLKEKAKQDAGIASGTIDPNADGFVEITPELIAKSASNSNGVYMGDGDIYINKPVARQSDAWTTVSHEILHPIINALIGTEANQEENYNELMKIIPTKMKNEINKRIDKSQGKSKRSTEFLQYMSEAIMNDEVSYDETVFDKIRIWVNQMLSKLKGQKGLENSEELHFDSARGVYNFIKEFSESSKKGEISQAAIDAVNKGQQDTGNKISEDTGLKAKRPQYSISVSEAEANLEAAYDADPNDPAFQDNLEAAQDALEAAEAAEANPVKEEVKEVAVKQKPKPKAKVERKKEPVRTTDLGPRDPRSKKIMDTYNEGMEGVKRTEYKASKPLPASLEKKLIPLFEGYIGTIVQQKFKQFETEALEFQDALSILRTEVGSAIRTFNPAKNKDLAGYVKKIVQTRQSLMFKDANDEFTSDLDDAKTVVAEQDGPSIDRSGNVERGQATFDELDIVDDTLINDIAQELSKEIRVRTQKGTLSEKVKVKKGRDVYEVTWLENYVNKQLFKKLSKKLGAIGESNGETVIPGAYIDFLNDPKTFDIITKALPIKSIKKSYNKLFPVTKIGREVTAEGNPIYKIEKIDKRDFLTYFVKGKKSAILERQKQLFREILEPIAKDIMADYVSDPSNLTELESIKELAPQESVDAINEITTEAALRQLESALDRYKGEEHGFDNIQFSANSSVNATLEQAVVNSVKVSSEDARKFLDLLTKGGLKSEAAKKFLVDKGISEKHYDTLTQVIIAEGMIAAMQTGRASNQGIKYEKALVRVLQKFTKSNVKVKANRKRHGDLVVQSGTGKKFREWIIEVKLNIKAQLGGTSAGALVMDGDQVSVRAAEDVKLYKKLGKDNTEKFNEFIKSEKTQTYLESLAAAVNAANAKSTKGKAGVSKSGHIALPYNDFWDNIIAEMPGKQVGSVSYKGDQSIIEEMYKGVDVMEIGEYGAYAIGADSKLLNKYNILKATTNNVYRPIRSGKTVMLRFVPNFDTIANGKENSLSTKEGIVNLAEAVISNSIRSYSKSGPLTVYHGGDVKKKSDATGMFLYFSPEEKQAQAYADGNQGTVGKFIIQEENIVDEQAVLDTIEELKLQPEDTGWSSGESNLYELIDDRFEQVFSKKDLKKLSKALKKKGIKASTFTDTSLITGRDVENIVVFDTGVVQFSKSTKAIDKDFRKIVEDATGYKANSKIGEAAAKVAGSLKGRFKFFIPPSADDFAGLMYKLTGKGKLGEYHQAWFKEVLFDPFAKGYRDFESYKENATREVNAIKKGIKNIPNGLKETNPTGFTNEVAVRVYLWTKNGHSIEGLTTKEQKALINIVANDADLVNFANQMDAALGGYPAPQSQWFGGSITTDAISAINVRSRADFMAEWKKNADAVFTKDNINKLTAAFGENYTEALQDMLYRMEFGRNRPTGKNKLTNNFMNWVNDSVGTIMFFNTRSALLQTLSIANFINWGENNPIAAAKAFANQEQFWADFSMLFNSDFLKQRRSGLKNDINADEIATAAETATNKSRAVLSSILKAGFLPTQIADSFAIAMGGASFIRNRINKYVSEGLSKKAAEKKAFLDFQEVAEETQQSSRPDRVSQQQASPLGRIVLAFANTPMQYMRLTKKAVLDIKNGRGDLKTNLSKIAYYALIQNVIFSSLQTALFAAMMDEDDEEIDKKQISIANSMLDSVLRGVGVYGAIVSTLKNIVMEIDRQSKKPRPDFTQAALRALSISPPVDSKMRKIISTARAFSFKSVREKMVGYGLDNPAFYAVGQSVSAVFNIPLDRAIRKADNIRVAMDNETKYWQSLALMLGFSQWDLGLVETSSNKKKSKWGTVAKWETTKNNWK